ncbi:glycosyltransferase family 4 protein [Yoonia sp. 208BN28-4]|uniref:glycosyltransferase family 4 protein n=1 Tax=Yoonia sp. 208BN28-4 TaxID=3126505 RepID=UPI00309BA74A
MTSKLAIFFHSDAVEGDGKDLVGRRSSGKSFLKGFLEHSTHDPVRAFVSSPDASEGFEQAARACGERRGLQVSSLRSEKDWTDAGAIVFPGPGYLDATWRRQHFDPTACSLIGITHTVSTRRVMTGLHNLLLEPVEPWDAIICTSRAVQSVVERQMGLSVEFIKQRFGATRVTVPQLPVIPLGINAEDFRHSPRARAAMRKTYDAPDDAVVVMTMGRLTVVEKANPVPLFLALEEVAQKTGKPVHLWMVGWASRQSEMTLHKDGSRLCPSVKVSFIDGRDPQVRRDIWSGADIFTLPVDNIQETFGLVPVEAMAAGLPVVMPDWNGFRDTVVDGTTGFLIPTAMPAPGSDAGARLARRFAAGTDGYLSHLSIVQQQTQIDMRRYVAALADLVANPDLRKTMGQAGHDHVSAKFDWSKIIPQYQALADDLAKMRTSAKVTSPRFASGPINPLEVDPFDLYAGYPTGTVDADTLVTPRAQLHAPKLAELDQVNGRKLYKRKMMPDAKVIAVSAWLAENGPATVADIGQGTGINSAVVTASVLFLAKYDFVALTVLKPN